MKRITKIQKELNNKNIKTIEQENQKYTLELSKELDTNPEFSLEIDPTNKYNMSEQQKTFIKYYVDFKSLTMAADLAGISREIATTYFTAYSSQQEIRRINRAMYQRQFSNKLLSIDEISRYLSSLITDENVPLADRVKTMDKVRIAQILIDLQLYKNDAINNPSNVIDVDIESEIKNLSIDSIKQLLNNKEHKMTDSQFDNSNLTIEEEAYLKTLPAKELLQIMETKNDKK